MRRIRFECQRGCTNCCDQQGYVYLTEPDLLRAAAYVNLSPADFESRYVYRTARLLRLRKPLRSQCYFLNATGCSIHPAKPTQCRTFPFWPMLIEDTEEWSRARSYCPGIGKGDLVQIAVIEQNMAEMRAADEL